MKITKATQTVWRLENGHTIIGKTHIHYFVELTNNVVVLYNKAEMIEIYRLTEDQFDDIKKSGI